MSAIANKSRDQLKILLLQIREDEATMLEKFYEFVQYGKLKEEQVTKLNTYETADFEPDVMDGYDALFIGGSSDASVLNPAEFKFIHNCQRLVRHCYDNNIPVLASCFGFQIAVSELGGKVEFDEANKETGSYPIKLTAAAKDDPLLYDYPAEFYAISGHKERAVSIPDDAILLGSTELCPYHIIKFKNKPIYGFQFHPEVSFDDFINRMRRYFGRYINDERYLQHLIDTAVKDTQDAHDLIWKFIDRIVLGKPEADNGLSANDANNSECIA